MLTNCKKKKLERTSKCFPRYTMKGKCIQFPNNELKKIFIYYCWIIVKRKIVRMHTCSCKTLPRLHKMYWNWFIKQSTLCFCQIVIFHPIAVQNSLKNIPFGILCSSILRLFHKNRLILWFIDKIFLESQRNKFCLFGSVADLPKLKKYHKNLQYLFLAAYIFTKLLQYCVQPKHIFWCIDVPCTFCNVL